ncbi:MAG: 50S ribosomal protein L18 [Thermoguttaceae bacterium]
MDKQQRLNKRRIRRAFRVSNHVKRYSTRPRLCVFRSNKHITAQIIDDATGKTLISAGTTDKALRGGIKVGGNCEAAVAVGVALAQKAVAAGIKQVAFDRHGYKYHGRVKALADAARKGGLDMGAFTEEPVAKKEAAEPKAAKKDTAASGDKAAKKQAAPKTDAKKK